MLLTLSSKTITTVPHTHIAVDSCFDIIGKALLSKVKWWDKTRSQGQINIKSTDENTGEMHLIFHWKDFLYYISWL